MVPVSRPVFQVDPHVGARIEEGKAQLDKLVTDPAAQGCWSKAVSALKAGCRSMDDTQRSKLAVTFTNCHLEKSDLPTYACTDAMDVAQCTRPMVDSVNSIAYSAYTTFYTHAESMCFYLQSEEFQRATEHAVDALHASAQGTADRLVELQAQASHMVDDTKAIRSDQRLAVEAAQELLAGQQKASQELGALSEAQATAFANAERSVKKLGGESQAALRELKKGAEEIGTKQGLLLGGLDRVLSLQGSLMGEFIDVKTVFIYTCAVLLALALTSTKPTAGARLPLFALLVASLVLERLLALMLCSPERASPEAVASLHGWIGMLRRAVGGLGLGLLFHAAFHHTDVSKRTLLTLDELKAMHTAHTCEMQERLARLEKEAAALRRKETSSMAIAVQALKHGRRALSPIHAASGKLSPAALGGAGGGRRTTVSPLARLSGGGSACGKKRHAHSPASTTGRKAGLLDGADGMPDGTAASCSAHDDMMSNATAETEANPPPPPPPSDCTQPPSPPQEGEKAPIMGGPMGGSSTTTTLSGLAASGLEAMASAMGGTPAARKARHRRSSVGSDGTDSLTPTRRSARLASKMASKTGGA